MDRVVEPVPRLRGSLPRGRVRAGFALAIVGVPLLAAPLRALHNSESIATEVLSADRRCSASISTE